MGLSISKSEMGKLFIKDFQIKVTTKMFKVRMDKKENLYYTDLTD